MKVLFFGVYNINDTVNNRTRILLKGLKNLGVEVEECNAPVASWKRFWHLANQYRKTNKDYDIMFLAHGGAQLVAPLARILTRKKIVADPIVSLYDTMVHDRKKCRRMSIRGFYYYFIDWLMIKLVDIVILDTEENIKYFSNNFHAKRSKFKRLFIGSENTPCPIREMATARDFVVHFHGYFIPLHGIEYIVRAAKILENEHVIFRIMGKGQTYRHTKKLAEELRVKNVNFIDPVPRSDIQKYLCDSDVVLGIFGNTDKALRVIPNKAYDALAAGKALITADTPAIKELLEDRNNCLLCRIADPGDLAAKVLELKNNQNLLKKISNAGRELFEKKLDQKILSLGLKKIIEETLSYA